MTPWRNHRELERDYWAAVRGYDVIVVDDGSDPPLPNAWRLESVRDLTREAGARLPVNNAHGFSHACNAGLELARTDAVLFLNNDVVMTRPGWLEPIRAALEPGVLVGAELRYDRHADVDGRSFPYLDGWCLAGMRDDLLELEGFDEGYMEPAYYSDNDLCLRARLAGMSLRQVDVGLRHLGNRTAGPGTDPLVHAATLANRDRYVTRAREALVAA